MSRTWYLTHARIVTPDEVLADVALHVEDGVIRAIDPESGGGAPEIDLRGQYLMPGIVDLHSDALEQFLAPRAGSLLPPPFGVAHLDRQLAVAGITTCFHATAFGGESMGARGIKTAAMIVRAVIDFAPHALVDNRVHCRYEVTEPDALPVIEMLVQEGCCGVVSVMDHSPGQGQFVEADAYREHLQFSRKMSSSEINLLFARMSENSATAHDRICKLAATARECSVAFASHDDDSPERVNEMVELGASIAEFPVQREAAAEARRHDMCVIVGAPNVLRGGSHNGNLRAADLIRAGWANSVASDYVPAAMLAGAFRLVEELDLSLPAVMRLFSLEPARAVGLLDRGSIAPGKRADLIAVRHFADQPLVTRTWCNGQQVLVSDRGQV